MTKWYSAHHSVTLPFRCLAAPPHGAFPRKCLTKWYSAHHSVTLPFRCLAAPPHSVTLPFRCLAAPPHGALTGVCASSQPKPSLYVHFWLLKPYPVVVVRRA